MCRTGYKLYSLNSVDKLDMIYESPCRDVTIVERLFSSSLIGYYLGYLVVDLHWSRWVRSEDVVGQCCLRT
jgi:hypothetical protein